MQHNRRQFELKANCIDEIYPPQSKQLARIRVENMGPCDVYFGTRDKLSVYLPRGCGAEFDSFLTLYATCPKGPALVVVTHTIEDERGNLLLDGNMPTPAGSSGYWSVPHWPNGTQPVAASNYDPYDYGITSWRGSDVQYKKPCTHKWVETGTNLIFCKECDDDGEYDGDGKIVSVGKRKSVPNATNK